MNQFINHAHLSKMINLAGAPPWKYFAYGMNMNPDGMRFRCPSTKLLGKATVGGWARVARGVFDLKPSAGARTEGALWELDVTDLAALDQLEGFPHYYTRRLVPVEFNGETIIAMTYTMTEENSRHESPLVGGYATTCLNACEDLGIALDEPLKEAARRFGIPVNA